jgi:hypothetical protein
MINLADPLFRTQLSQKLKQDIEDATKAHFTDEPRKHLGASIIGHECSAYLWGTFRWLKQEDFSGRMLRLFNRGHLEEARFIKWLTLVGFTCYEINPETGKQFQISGVNGHFGGSLDCIVSRADIGNLLTEFKTHGEKSFVKLKAEGVRKAKPQHYRQMCSYGKLYQLKYGLYCAVNKNTDELHFEIVELDWSLADDLMRKADSIINSQVQPQKIAQNETYFDCKYCHFSGICFRGESPDKNCRSCAHCVPVENARWNCNLADPMFNPIPEDFVPNGCEKWRRII